MKSAPIPANETERLVALRDYGILDTPPESAFDDLTRLAAQICETPIALVTLVDAQRQWFKSRLGFELAESAREISFCAHAILQTDLFEVEDTSRDPRFADYFTRSKHINELYGLVGEAAATKTTQEWLDVLKPLSIPVVKTNRLDDLEEDPHLKAVGLFERYDHPEVGAYNQLRPPVRFSRSPSNIRRHPPRLGQHTDELLSEIGMEIEEGEEA